MAVIYGIKNCDTMKKALKWLEAKSVHHHFHDYKKEGVPADVIQRAIDEHGWEQVINKRGTTWRNLSDDIKNATDDKTANMLAKENASIIKRPLLCHEGQIYLGFKAERYQGIFL